MTLAIYTRDGDQIFFRDLTDEQTDLLINMAEEAGYDYEVE